MRGRLVSLVTGRRSRWAVVAAWAAAAVALGIVTGRLHQETSSDSLSFVPSGAESAQASQALAADFPSVPDTPAIVVYQRAEGLDSRDYATIARDVAVLLERLRRVEIVDLEALAEARATGESLTGATDAVGSAQPAGLVVSKDKTTALLPIPIDTKDGGVLRQAVDEIRATVEEGPPRGLTVHVTGPAGLDVDSSRILGDLGPMLLVASVALILVLLAAIYRAVLAPLLPIVTIGAAYAVAAGLVYLAVDALDVALSSQATSLLVILMFGVGTDYCVYLLARYREELGHGQAPQEALRAAVGRSVRAIVSCAATVVGTMLVLLVADLESTRTLGPVLAVGVAVTMLAALTLLPALLALLGPATFWPRRPVARGTAGGVWSRLGRAVVARPGLLALACVLLLGGLTAGSAANLGALPVNDGFREETDSLAGARAIERAFPPGEIGPTTVVVQAPRDGLAAASKRVVEALDRDATVATVRENGVDAAGTAASLTAVLALDPFSDRAVDAIPRLRESVDAALGGTGASALVGGPTAGEYDAARTVRADARLILPITLAVVFAVLVVLLRALVAPLYLVLTVVLSYAATLGLTSICLKWLFGAPGLMVGFSTFLFLFVVALGVDYNVFLMSRIREECARSGTNEAVRRGLEATGSVITTAGVILGGTFALAMLAPIWQLFQLGFAVATGVLIDTLLVRTLLVPAITRLLGDRAWWPGKAPRRPDTAQDSGIVPVASGHGPAHIERG